MLFITRLIDQQFNMESFKNILRGIAAETSTAFNRAVQYTEEKMGTSEKTELDPHFEGLALRCDKTKKWTENMVTQAELVLQPNPSRKVEDYLLEKFEAQKDRSTNSEHLGQYMIDSANDYGPESPYGNALIKVGHAQQRLGIAEREFAKNAYIRFIRPMHKFLECDMKKIMRERGSLEKRRLDLDVCKNRLKKTRCKDSESNVEQEFRTAKNAFDRQADTTRVLMEEISSAHANQLRCLNEFVEAQIVYYSQCQQHMADLQKGMVGLSSANSNRSSTMGFQTYFQTSSHCTPSIKSAEKNGKLAKVLYDYEALNESEISLVANDVITIYPSETLDGDYVRGEKDLKKGKVPLAFLKVLS